CAGGCAGVFRFANVRLDSRDGKTDLPCFALFQYITPPTRTSRTETTARLQPIQLTGRDAVVANACCCPRFSCDATAGGGGGVATCNRDPPANPLGGWGTNEFWERCGAAVCGR